MTGLQSIPNAETTTSVINLIRDKYRHLAPEEIVIAFKGAIVGEFPVKDMNHYQNFNAVYLSSVLNPYIKHRSVVIVDSRRDTQTTLGEPSEEQKRVIHDEFIRTGILEPYQKLIDSGEYTFRMETFLYETLESKGVLSLSTDEKKAIYEEAKTEFIAQQNEEKNNLAESKIATKIKERIETEGIASFDLTIRNRSKTMAFKRFIVEAANKKANLETLLK